MLSHTRMCSAGLFLALVAGNAPAAEIEDIFRTEDTNGDGAISVEEARAAAPATFRRIDQDGNGSVTVDEIAAYTVAEGGTDMVWPAEVLASVAQKTLEYWDANRDGKVSEQEYVEVTVALLLLADTNGDRQVTREELQRFRGEPVTP